MCNIAGYIGALKAAPILIKMIKLQEGLNGGFYTGLATHDGKCIKYRKTIGDLKRLLSTTDTELLEGNAGLAHSRTPSGGDSSWAHPFVTEKNGEVEICYVANGGLGYFSERNSRYNKLADSLVAEGFDIPCKLSDENERYNRLSSGEAVHMSDVMCQLIYKNKSDGKNMKDAMAKAFDEMPGEIVGLAMEKESSDKIFFSRINKPMFVGFDESGAYLASSPLAFPDSVINFELLPKGSSGIVYKNRYEVEKNSRLSETVRNFTDETLTEAKEFVLNLLKKGPFGAKDMINGFEELLGEGELMQADAIIYLVLYDLYKNEEIFMTQTEWEADGLIAPKTLFHLKN